MRSFVKVISTVILISTLCLCVSGCYPYPYLESDIGRVDEEELELIGQPSMRVEYNEEYREYEVYIEGFVKNLADTDRNNIYVSFVAYDSEGNTVTTVDGYCYYLEAGATWRFCATGYSSFEPASFKLVSLY